MASTFSYAQAAKGMSTTATPATQSKAPSGTTTPALTTEPTGINWAEEGEAASRALENGTEDAVKLDEPVTNGVQKHAMSAQPSGESGISSPSVAASTTTKDDDASSVRNASSESTWDNKSQASNPAEKPVEQTEAGSEKKQGKEKKEKKENTPPKPLQEAPIPQVNIWKQRAEANAAKAKVNPTPTAVKPAAPAVKAPAQTTASKSGDSKPYAAKKGKDGNVDESDSGKAIGARNRDEEQSSRRAQSDVSRPRRGPQNIGASQPPPVKDQESWPTPEDVQGEDRRKAQEKTEKSDKERPVAPAKGKNEWVSLPYTPTVVFNTPMPATGARRGGRGGGRGGAQVGGRPSPTAVNGASGAEKDAASTTGDQPRRGRADGASQDAQPSKAKRTSSVGSAGGLVSEGQRTEASAQAARSSNGDATSGTFSGSNGTQRNNAAPRQKMNRKFDQASSEKRKEDGSVSPSDTTGAGRRGSAAVQQPEEQGRRRSFSQGDGQPVPSRAGGSERRNGQFGSGSGRERGENRGRGSMRGRNSTHGYQNGHHGGFANGHASFSLPRSPPGYDQHPFFGQGAQQQRGYRGGRTQSLQTESMYGRHHPGYANGQALPLQTYMNGVYDYTMQPMSAVPYPPYVADPFQLLRTVQAQLEYYFSVDNLCKDMYLRKHMDSQGFVFLDFIAGFNRVKTLTTDMAVIRAAIAESTIIDHKVGNDTKDRLRRREGWEQWVMPTGNRDPSAQNDGPDELHQPAVAPLPAFDPRYMYPGSPVDMPTSPSQSGTFQPLNGIAQGASPVNGGMGGSELPNGGPYPDGSTSQFSSINVGAVPAFAPNPSPNGINPEADSFSNTQTKGLTVIVRKHEQPAEKQPGFHSEESRTFSNGSIDSRSIAEELHKSDAKQSGPQTNGHGPVEANEVRQPDVLTRSKSPFSQSGSSAMRLFWIKDQESPVQSQSLPPDANVVLYTDLYTSALNQRDAVPAGNCPYDMVVLYQFWSHFLIRNFNTRMYDEFRRLAFEDLTQRSSDVGFKCLVKYYGEALSSQCEIRQRVARHYVDIVMTEIDDRLAFTQLQTAWRDGTICERNRQKISAFLDRDLLASLEQ
ncbi:RNA-binding protein Lupus La [Macrophomina phaseolina MS6]|uniref:RNA-binding protein Lupus La n=1 Tax=Macrophomina phaseolina (strain MS6) TaxID=1126212 RepID=K2RX62_MACPH|nr:RNA-binding protein Lupus La [Macrophomina phaseolina MS6]